MRRRTSRIPPRRQAQIESKKGRVRSGVMLLFHSAFCIHHSAFPNTMTIETLPISTLSEDPANARRHPQRNLEQIKASLRRFGQQKPIVVDATNTVRAGNGTLAAARALGWTTIQAVRSELPK